MEFSLAMFVPILINMALLTLLERKVLSFSQIRVGPCKVGALGLLQPVADAVKLFSNKNSYVSSSVYVIYLASPAMALTLSLMMSKTFPTNVGGMSLEYMFLMMLLIFSLGVYPVLLGGWSSNSKYSFLGSVRGVAQTVSYEISLAFILLSIFLILGSYSYTLNNSLTSLGTVWFLPLGALWVVIILAELNRTPFDLSEGESELVSGFNTEYSSVKFALVFMGEYTMIMVLSILGSVLFFSLSSLAGAFMSVMLASSILWIRASFPRIRYDFLMSFSWKTLLPCSLGVLLYTGSPLGDLI